MKELSFGDAKVGIFLKNHKFYQEREISAIYGGCRLPGASYRFPVSGYLAQSAHSSARQLQFITLSSLGCRLSALGFRLSASY
jgi:hypothetical protein